MASTAGCALAGRIYGICDRAAWIPEDGIVDELTAAGLRATRSAADRIAAISRTKGTWRLPHPGRSFALTFSPGEHELLIVIFQNGDVP
jgi:hypothetical protein